MNRLLVWTCAVLAGGLWIALGVSKLAYSGSVNSAIAWAVPIGGALAGPMVSIVAVGEIVLGLMLLAHPIVAARRPRLAGFALAIVASCAFVMLLVSTLVRVESECGCFGALGRATS